MRTLTWMSGVASRLDTLRDKSLRSDSQEHKWDRDRGEVVVDVGRRTRS